MEAADEEKPLIHYLPPQDEGSHYTSDGTVDINKNPALKWSTGNWRACYLILGSEISESLAFSGIQKNLITYLTSVLHESNVDAAKNVSTWIGSCFFTPLIGAFLADTYWGTYWTVVIFISIQAVGMIALTVSTWLPLLMDSSFHPSTAAAYIVLRCTSGSISSPSGPAASSPAPRPLAPTNSTAPTRRSGKVYRYKRLEGSPLTRVSQVVVAAVRNCNSTLPADSSDLHEVSSPNETNLKTAHTCQFRFFDKAAIVAPSSSGEKGAASTVSPWRLCTVSQVEELKMLLRMFPVWASTVLFFAVTSQASSTFIEQGTAMDNRVGPFTVPPASLAIFHTITIIVGIPIYDAALVPLARRVTGNDRGLSQLRRLGVGLALSVATMAYAAMVEARRLAAVRGEGAVMSIVWQAPSFAVLGAAEVFSTSGVLEFFYDQSPGGMKSLGTSLALLTIAAGSYLNSAVLGVVAWATARGGAPGWIPDNLNEGHLDYFFWLMAALSVVNLLHFVHCSRRYRGNNTAS